MKKIYRNLLTILALTLATSCGEEVFTQNTLVEGDGSAGVQSFSDNNCTDLTLVKPPVDILYVVDNSGSSSLPNFQALKEQIRTTLSTISTEFDFHITIAPLMSPAAENMQSFQLMAYDVSNLVSAAVNLIEPKNVEMFTQAAGNNTEYGFTRAAAIIDSNRANGIFRNNSNTIVVLISNGDDNEAVTTIGGNQVPDSGKYTSLKNKFLSYTKSYADSNTVANPMNADSFRFISLVAHSNCNSWKKGSNYQLMSNDIYNYWKNNLPAQSNSNSDDNSASKDSVDLCSSDYSSIFKSVNKSIRAVIVGHEYDYWRISTASAAEIQEDDITLTKIKTDGSTEVLTIDPVNGFEYLGYKSAQNTRYHPTLGEPKTGLMVKLNGTAKLKYDSQLEKAECMIAKTRTPTEHFGYVAISREPQQGTIKVEIDGVDQPKSATNGWNYLGWHDVKNIKVPGSTSAAITPVVNRTGYIIQLNGSAIYTNGQSIKVFYKPAAL